MSTTIRKGFLPEATNEEQKSESLTLLRMRGGSKEKTLHFLCLPSDLHWATSPWAGCRHYNWALLMHEHPPRGSGMSTLDWHYNPGAACCMRLLIYHFLLFYQVRQKCTVIVQIFNLRVLSSNIPFWGPGTPKKCFFCFFFTNKFLCVCVSMFPP